MAIEFRQPEILELLLAAGSNPNRMHAKGFTVIFLAIGAGLIDMVETLASHGASLAPISGRSPSTPPSLAVNRICFVGFWSGAPKSTPSAPAGHTPLHLAVQKGRLDCIRTCLTFGADIDAHDSDLVWTPAMHALERSSEAMQALCEHGFDPDIKDESGKTVLDQACEDPHLPGAQVLAAWLLTHREHNEITFSSAGTLIAARYRPPRV